MDSTFLKGLRVLTHIVDRGGPCGVTALSRELGLPKSNIHRVLKTLEAAGLVRADPATRGYLPTLRLWDLGLRVYDSVDLEREAHVLLGDIARTTGETALVAVRDGLCARVMASACANSPRRPEQGERLPLHEGAIGRILLAHADIPHAERALTDAALPPGGLAWLRADMAESAARGCALDRGDWCVGQYGVAAPVRDIRGGVMAAIGVTGPIDRYSEASLAHMQELVTTAAAELSSRFGCAA
ncbi:IclR family transcriptional regulator [Paroceanicella profunda]|uniref:IclR family transcriptional regulator n=1 Tax=Paroceanicella profunda TaxID=2579971 RepID=A0A5B8FYU7_9RHOB|nr:IclR family transcriptional regulator [Paroceanicella profunda]QDL91859.1 IclR family transcriptional regulator [Paroceanicella profunda]